MPSQENTPQEVHKVKPKTSEDGKDYSVGQLRKYVLDEIDPQPKKKPVQPKKTKPVEKTEPRNTTTSSSPKKIATARKKPLAKKSETKAHKSGATSRERVVKSIPLTKKDIGHKKHTVRYLISVLLVFVVALLVMLYILQTQNIVTRFFIEHLPFPAMVVGGSVVTLKELYTHTSALSAFYHGAAPNDIAQQQLAPQKRDLLQRVQERLVYNLLAERIAKQFALTVSDEEVSREFTALTNGTSSGEEIEKMLNDLYGWTASEFQRYIVQPFLLQQKLQSALAHDTELNASIEERAEALRKRLENGEEFSSLAQEVSEGPNASTGGDLGWFGSGVLLPELEEAVLSLDEGVMSPVLRSAYGFHIFLVEEKSDDDAQVHARDIFLSTIRVDDYLKEKEKETFVLNFVH